MKVVVPGGSGYLGRAVAKRLVDRGDDVVVLARGRVDEPVGRIVAWDGATLGPWVDELDGADAVVHLTGKRVDVRATRHNIDELITSRVGPVALVGDAIRHCAAPPPVWVQSATLALFGHTGDEVITDQPGVATMPSGIGPREMVTVAMAWEQAYRLATAPVERAVLLRTGIAVGGAGDPATAKLAQLVRMGLGGSAGSGRQWVSWVSLDDTVEVMLRAIDDSSMRGTYHVTAPDPVRNSQMMRTYRRLLGRRFGLPSPGFVVRLGAPLLGSSGSLALTGRRAEPRRLLDEGYEFVQPSFDTAVRTALANAGRQPTANGAAR